VVAGVVEEAERVARLATIRLHPLLQLRGHLAGELFSCIVRPHLAGDLDQLGVPVKRLAAEVGVGRIGLRGRDVGAHGLGDFIAFAAAQPREIEAGASLLRRRVPLQFAARIQGQGAEDAGIAADRRGVGQQAVFLMRHRRHGGLPAVPGLVADGRANPVGHLVGHRGRDHRVGGQLRQFRQRAVGGHREPGGGLSGVQFNGRAAHLSRGDKAILGRPALHRPGVSVGGEGQVRGQVDVRRRGEADEW